MSLVKLAGTLFLFPAMLVHAQADDAKLAAELRAKDMVLLNAVHRGDRKTWSDNTSDDFLYIEDGEISRRDAFLQELAEDGATPLIITSFEVHRIGDTALVLHLDDVPQRPLRDRSKSHLLFSETWQKTGGEWKLRRVDITRLRIDPPSISLTHTQMDELIGTYKAGTNTYTVRREGEHILAARKGEPEQEWKAETRDVLFAPGEARSRKIFLRDSEGHVVSFADRDESSEIVWKRQANPPQ